MKLYQNVCFFFVGIVGLECLYIYGNFLFKNCFDWFAVLSIVKVRCQFTKYCQKIGKWFCRLRITFTIKLWHILVVRIYTDNIMKIILKNKLWKQEKLWKKVWKLLLYVCPFVFVFVGFLISLFYFFVETDCL